MVQPTARPDFDGVVGVKVQAYDPQSVLREYILPGVVLLNPDGSIPTGIGNQVQGTAADNATAVGNPVQVGGTDGTGKMQTLAVNAAGAINIAAATSTPYRLVSSLATTNALLVKNAAGTIFHIFGGNTVASWRYLKIYNKASAPTVGTDTPYITLALPPSAGFAFDIPEDIALSTGIAIAITGLPADADTTAIGLADIVGLNILYS